MKRNSGTIELARLAADSKSEVPSMVSDLEGREESAPSSNTRWPTRFISVGEKVAPRRWGTRFLAAGPKSAPTRD
jgi:hypothetical protein